MLTFRRGEVVDRIGKGGFWMSGTVRLAVVIVVGSVAHGMLIEGTMEATSKAALCALVLAAAIKVMADLWVWRKRATAR